MHHREAMQSLCKQHTSKACIPQSGQKFTDQIIVYSNFYAVNSSKTFIDCIRVDHFQVENKVFACYFNYNGPRVRDQAAIQNLQTSRGYISHTSPPNFAILLISLCSFC